MCIRDRTKPYACIREIKISYLKRSAKLITLV
jgi:hypothetical protein